MVVVSILSHAEFGFNDHRKRRAQLYLWKNLNGHLVLSNMLSKSNINPFDSQEAKPYKNDPEIIAMTRSRYSFDICPPLYIWRTLRRLVCCPRRNLDHLTIGNTHFILWVNFQRSISKWRYWTISKNFEFDPQIRLTIMGDQFIKENIESLLRLIRTQVLVKLKKPYTR